MPRPLSATTSRRSRPMPSFQFAGVRLAYLDEGSGEPIVLVHGFGSNAHVNWVYPGWVTTLVGAGRRVIALDNRGHGASDKPRTPADYAPAVMADDVRRLMDHAGLARADLMGYSLGAIIAANLAIAHPERVRSAVFAGMGSSMVEVRNAREEIAAALEAPSDEAVTSAEGRGYRAFARQTRSDFLALAACMRGARQPVDPQALAQIRCPVLVAVGTRDAVAGSARMLADLIPGAKVLDIPDRDHMLAVGDRAFKAGVLAFLGARP